MSFTFISRFIKRLKFRRTIKGDQSSNVVDSMVKAHLWGIERSGFFNGRGKWAKGFENQRV